MQKKLAGKIAKPAGAPGSSGMEMQNRSRLPLTGGERLEDVWKFHWELKVDSASIQDILFFIFIYKYEEIMV